MIIIFSNDLQSTIIYAKLRIRGCIHSPHTIEASFKWKYLSNDYKMYFGINFVVRHQLHSQINTPNTLVWAIFQS